MECVGVFIIKLVGKFVISLMSGFIKKFLRKVTLQITFAGNFCRDGKNPIKIYWGLANYIECVEEIDFLTKMTTHRLIEVIANNFRPIFIHLTFPTTYSPFLTSLNNTYSTVHLLN